MSTYVLKDSQGNYVSKDSIRYNESTKKIVYSYSKLLTNGFYNDSVMFSAILALGKLQAANEKYRLGKSFSIEEIDLYDTLVEENKTHSIKAGVSSIKHDYFDTMVIVPPCKSSRPSNECDRNIENCPCPHRKIA